MAWLAMKSTRHNQHSPKRVQLDEVPGRRPDRGHPDPGRTPGLEDRLG